MVGTTVSHYKILEKLGEARPPARLVDGYRASRAGLTERPGRLP